MNVRTLNRYFYADSIEAFSSRGTDEIVGTIAIANSFPLTVEQRDAWVMQIAILRDIFARLAVPGYLYDRKPLLHRAQRLPGSLSRGVRSGMGSSCRRKPSG